MNRNTEYGDTRIVKTAIRWDADNLPLLVFLAGRFTYRDAGEWRRLIDDGTVTVNREKCAPDRILHLHDIVEYRPGELPEPPAELSYRTLYEDDALIVVGKPGNLCVHPAGPFFKHTLWYLLRARYGNDIHFVNRLDRETSGAMIVARRPGIAAALETAPAEKTYRAVVHGDFPAEIDAHGFLFRDPASLVRKKRRFAVRAPENVRAETAETFLKKIGGNGNFSHLEIILGTGRMHQIRATLLALGHPVVGDKLYGLDEAFYLRQKNDALSDDDRAKLILTRQALHSYRIRFRHPETREEIEILAPEPEEFRSEFFS
ncbi:MAG: RluA family pseudouridine synthase [Victivallaceae bacterium]|nr:RluA family pseudouridine synthase [Victivallaceae bacterium]